MRCKIWDVLYFERREDECGAGEEFQWADSPRPHTCLTQCKVDQQSSVTPALPRLGSGQLRTQQTGLAEWWHWPTVFQPLQFSLLRIILKFTRPGQARPGESKQYRWGSATSTFEKLSKSAFILHSIQISAIKKNYYFYLVFFLFDLIWFDWHILIVLFYKLSGLDYRRITELSQSMGDCKAEDWQVLNTE